MYCKECGRRIADETVCPFCGAKQNRTDENEFYSFSDFAVRVDNDGELKNNGSFFHKSESFGEYGTKSRITAGVLQLFCGALGIGRFYMGYKTYAVLQIAASVITCGVGGVIWGAADGIAILTGKVLYVGDDKILI